MKVEASNTEDVHIEYELENYNEREKLFSQNIGG
jgi:hypothetical protein